MCGDIEKKFVDMICSKNASSVRRLAPLRKSGLFIDGTIDEVSVRVGNYIRHRHRRVSNGDEFMLSILVTAENLYRMQLSTLRAQAVDNQEEVHFD